MQRFPRRNPPHTVGRHHRRHRKLWSEQYPKVVVRSVFVFTNLSRCCIWNHTTDLHGPMCFYNLFSRFYGNFICTAEREGDWWYLIHRHVDCLHKSVVFVLDWFRWFFKHIVFAYIYEHCLFQKQQHIPMMRGICALYLDIWARYISGMMICINDEGDMRPVFGYMSTVCSGNDNDRHQ